MSARRVTAMAVYRWRGALGCWWFEVIVMGERGGKYVVDLVQSDGRRGPMPFGARRVAGATKHVGRSSDALKDRLYAEALAAVDGSACFMEVAS